MSSRHCRYSGFSTLRKLARHQIMKSCPICSSTVILCRVFSAHLSAREAVAGEAAGLLLSLSLAVAGRARESARTRKKEAEIRDIAGNDSRSGGSGLKVLGLGLPVSTVKTCHLRPKTWHHDPQRLALNRGIISEPSQPPDLRLAPEPCHLPLSIVAMGLLRGMYGLVLRQFSMQQLPRLAIPERSQGTHRRAMLRNQTLGFFDEPVLKHPRGADIDSVIQRGALRF